MTAEEFDYPSNVTLTPLFGLLEKKRVDLSPPLPPRVEREQPK
jgi:hypothetical protein